MDVFPPSTEAGTRSVNVSRPLTGSGSNIALSSPYEGVARTPQGQHMFSAEHFRAKAREYTLQMKDTVDPGALPELKRLEQSFTGLANNEEWLARRVENSLLPGGPAEGADNDSAGRTAAQIDEHILRCLGGAVIMQWNSIPTKLQRELFDTAGSMGDVLKTAELRGQIARFLHDHKDHQEASAS